jgi:hypothetical protein
MQVLWVSATQLQFFTLIILKTSTITTDKQKYSSAVGECSLEGLPFNKPL